MSAVEGSRSANAVHTGDFIETDVLRVAGLSRKALRQKHWSWLLTVQGIFIADGRIRAVIGDLHTSEFRMYCPLLESSWPHIPSLQFKLDESEHA